MPTPSTTLSRRDCLKRGLLSLAVIPAGLIASSTAMAASHQGVKLSESDPASQALGYVHDAAKVDVQKFPKRGSAKGKTQVCSSYRFFQADASAEWDPCQIFGQKLVSGPGWCNGWIAKESQE